MLKPRVVPLLWRDAAAQDDLSISLKAWMWQSLLVVPEGDGGGSRKQEMRLGLTVLGSEVTGS